MACVKWSPSSLDPPLYSLPEHVGGMFCHVSNCWGISVWKDPPVGNRCADLTIFIEQVVITQSVSFVLRISNDHRPFYMSLPLNSVLSKVNSLKPQKDAEVGLHLCSMSPYIRKNIILIEVFRVSLFFCMWVNEYGALTEWFLQWKAKLIG
jgi:hypothetical protein